MASLRKTKIVATLGRKTSSKEAIVELIKTGIDGVRLSKRFLRESLDRVMANLRAAEEETNQHLAVMLSLRESDIRIGTMDPNSTLSVYEGDVIHITTSIDCVDKPNLIYCNNKELPNIVEPGKRLIAEFGKAYFTVIDVQSVRVIKSNRPPRASIITSVSFIDEKPQPAFSIAETPTPLNAVTNTNNPEPTSARSRSVQHMNRVKRTKPKKPKEEWIVVCRAEHNYTFTAWSPIHIESDKPIAFMNELEDIRTLEWGGANDVDYIVYKQVRGIEDLENLFAFNTAPGTKRMIGVQTRECTEMIEQFLNFSDGVVLGRGNLALETSVSEACKIQKSVVKRCNELGKPVVLSTQVLDSMVLRSRPTRTEVVDIANSIYDGVDAILLTSETAHGRNPSLAVTITDKIARDAESNMDYSEESDNILKHIISNISVAENICYCAVRSVLNLNLKLIICITQSGYTAQMISRFKPPCVILALTDSLRVVRQLRLVRGVFPALMQNQNSSEAFTSYALNMARSHNLLKEGEMAVYVAGGSDSFQAGDTCSLRILTL